MKAPGLPGVLKIGPYRYTVRQKVNLHRKAEDMAYTAGYVHEGDVVHLRGLHVPDDLRIEVRDGMPLPLTRVTVVHEILHALVECSRVDTMFDNPETEEKFVQRFAPWLTGVLQENPRLVEFLTDRRQGGAGSATWWRRNG